MLFNRFKYKYLFLWPLWVILLITCKPERNDPPTLIDPFVAVPANKEFIELEMKNKTILWIENDSISIGYSSAYARDSFSDSDRILSFEYKCNLRHRVGSDSWQENIYFSFHKMIPKKESLDRGLEELCKYTKTADIDKMFLTGPKEVNEVPMTCQEPTNLNKNRVSLFIDLYDRMENGRRLFEQRKTTSSLCTPVLDQRESTAEVRALKPFNDPLWGDGWMVEVQFKVNLYDLYDNNPKLALGRARFFVVACKD